jgi:TonB dependent receptor
VAHKKGNQYRRKALTLALAMCLASGVSAQSNTAGAVVGHASSGDTITISNPANGFSRTITVGTDGSYRFSQLPSGQYQISRNGGASKDVTVSVGSAANVDFADGSASTLGTVTVIGAGSINPIDVSSVESTTILTAEQIKKIPVAQNTTAVALLAPGTVRGDAAFGNLASFGGSSVAENQYFLNGFNITNSFRGLNFAQLPFEAIAEQQVKTGGYGAEFGRSLGGVVNQITRRGSNDFKAGANIYWAPASLGDDAKNTYYSNPLTPNRFGQLRSDNSADSAWTATANVWASGPLVKDRLFAYALYSRNETSNDFWGSVVAPTNVHFDLVSPTWLVKLDWNISDNHLLELTAFSDRQETNTDTYRNTIGILNRTGFQGRLAQEQGGNNYVMKYTGYLSDTFTLSALYGHGEFSRSAKLIGPDGSVASFDGDISSPVQQGCPVVVDGRAASRIALTGVYSSSCNISGNTIDRLDSGDTRDQFRLDAEWQLGDHRVRFGYDRDSYESIAGVAIEGGYQWTYLTLSPNTPTARDIVQQQYFSNGATVKVNQNAFYVDDFWNVSDNLVIYLGGRWDTFENFNGAGESYVKIKNQFGPRLGFSWDVGGDSSLKIFGNAGRYALPLTPSVAIRGASASLFSRETFTFTGVDPTTGEPTGLVSRGDFFYLNGEDGNSKTAATIASSNLKPMFQDEYILGFQKQMNEHFSVGVRGIHRDLKAAIDDNCEYTALLTTAGFQYNAAHHAWERGGRAAALPSSGLPYCRIFNPGEDAIWLSDFFGDGVLEETTVPAALISPKAKRTYTALEAFFDGSWDKFFLQGSYTFAKNKGNTEGGVKSDNGQGDTNVTQDFDYLALTTDTYGYLPNDRRHSLKLFGNYQATDEFSVGVNLLVQSGRPVNCFGVLDLNPALPVRDANGNIVTRNYSPHPYGSSFQRCGTTIDGGVDDAAVQRFPRGSKGRLPWTNQVDLNLTYTPDWSDGLTIKAEIFNLFNSQRVIAVNEIAEVRATGAPSETYLLPDNYQTPRFIQFMVQYDWK